MAPLTCPGLAHHIGQQARPHESRPQYGRVLEHFLFPWVVLPLLAKQCVVARLVGIACHHTHTDTTNSQNKNT